MANAKGGHKKSLYIFLTSILGVLLFLMLHRIIVFFYLLALSTDYARYMPNLSYIEFLAIDYFTLVITLMLGAWYGIWLGLYWYEKVYEEGSHGGLVSHITEHYWPKGRQAYGLEPKIEAVKKKLEQDLWELEDLAKIAPPVYPEPIKKRVVRKRAPAKLKSL